MSTLTGKTYNTFSSDPKLATYESNLTHTKLISAIARLRLSSHNLEIERGRHTRPKTPVASLICQRCQTNQVDDEIHFLMQCNPFELDRKALPSEAEKYITNFNTLSETEKFTYMMRSENHTIVNTLTKYTYAYFEKILVWKLPKPLTWPGSRASHKFHIILLGIYVVLSSHYVKLLCGTITRHLVPCDSSEIIYIYSFTFCYY